jgi:hypothetical protein
MGGIIQESRASSSESAMLNTPSTVADDGWIFVLVDDAGRVAAFVDEATARQHKAVSGRVKVLTLNEATKMADGEMGKAVVDAFKSALFSSAPMAGFYSAADRAKRTIISSPWPASARQS